MPTFPRIWLRQTTPTKSFALVHCKDLLRKDANWSLTPRFFRRSFIVILISGDQMPFSPLSAPRNQLGNRDIQALRPGDPVTAPQLPASPSIRRAVDQYPFRRQKLLHFRPALDDVGCLKQLTQCDKFVSNRKVGHLERGSFKGRDLNLYLHPWGAKPGRNHRGGRSAFAKGPLK